MTQGAQQPPGPRWHSKGWWQAVGGIAGVIAAVVAIGAWLLPRSADGDDDQVQPPPPTSTGRVSTPPSTPPPSTPPPSTPPPTSGPPSTPPATDEPTSGPEGTVKVRWSGDFLMHNVTGVDLDQPRPTTATGPKGNWDDGDLQYWNPEARDYALYAQPMAEWDGRSAPSWADCDNALETLAIGGIVPAGGDKLCVRTTGGRTAFVTIKSAEYDNLRLSITVWET
ncbi:hypothetical protein KOI35_12400 [Actinoplanes bogorensis]|uniref:Uncharacterized protein n=1 Tax=Paractinoplanes bogorensis TaxID=1610840 RepID=A0ABS5YLH8_9ACTN|nr:hypothetical protein [Actinoplanes bogorensis]MBU2664295.1 hypothetical protein [Actinoplanes bogorensis]